MEVVDNLGMIGQQFEKGFRSENESDRYFLYVIAIQRTDAIAEGAIPTFIF